MTMKFTKMHKSFHGPWSNVCIKKKKENGDPLNTFDQTFSVVMSLQQPQIKSITLNRSIIKCLDGVDLVASEQILDMKPDLDHIKVTYCYHVLVV